MAVPVVAVPCVDTAEAVCLCAVVARPEAFAARSLYYALNGLGSMTQLVVASRVLPAHGLRRAVYCDRSRTVLKVSPATLMPKLRLCWLCDRGHFDFSAYSQLVNHFSNEALLTQKHALAHHVRAYCERHGIVRPVHPRTLDLERPLDCQELRRSLAEETTERRYWIVKPVDDSSGRGIHVIRSLAELYALYPTARQHSDADGALLDGYLAQRYMTRPMLLDGYKFNTRVYLFIAQLGPVPRVYWHPGYITKAIAPFSLADTSVANLMAHVSNTRLQKDHPEFAARKDDQKWTWTEFCEHVSVQRLIPGSAAAVATLLEARIEAKLAVLFHAVRSLLDARPGQFALYGVDFLVEASGEPMLIECNKSPSHSATHRGVGSEAQLVPALIDDVLNVELALQERPLDTPPVQTFRTVDLTLVDRHDSLLYSLDGHATPDLLASTV